MLKLTHSIICDQILEFVTFHTLNIYSLNTVLHSINQQYSKLSVSLYHELPETLWNILIAASVFLRQQGKVLGSIYFMRDKVVDLPISGHICKTYLTPLP